MKPRRLLSHIALLGACGSVAATPPEAINIWEGTACHSKVMMTVYPSGREDTPCVIVCPGGSYFWLDRTTEGYGVAEWLRSEGVSACVLEYRVAGVTAFITHYRLVARGNRYPDMLADVQRAVQLVKERPDDLGIASGKVGVMGFSAGGHLAAMSGMFFDSDILNRYGIVPSCSLKPDFVAPIYPVVSFIDESAHKRSRRGALGEGGDISGVMKDSLSLERHVRPEMPPVFLMNCKDDPTVHYRNSELLDSALTANGVDHVYIQYQSGGHGFGANPAKTSREAIAWKEAFINWLKSL